MTDVCLVTGSTRGIGLAITKRLVSDGFTVIGLGRSRPENWDGQFIECDLLDSESLTDACDEIRQLDNLWCVVNNAGVGYADSLEQITLKEMSRVFMANTFAPALITQAAVEVMNDGGRVVNICSNVALGRVERSSYGSSKAALAALTRSWALDLAHRSITVNAISPGPIETELFRSRNPVGSESEARQLADIPLRRFGQPDQIASAVAFLADRNMYYCTGQIIYIDGGGSVGRAPI